MLAPLHLTMGVQSLTQIVYGGCVRGFTVTLLDIASSWCIRLCFRACCNELLPGGGFIPSKYDGGFTRYLNCPLQACKAVHSSSSTKPGPSRWEAITDGRHSSSAIIMEVQTNLSSRRRYARAMYSLPPTQLSRELVTNGKEMAQHPAKQCSDTAADAGGGVW